MIEEIRLRNWKSYKDSKLYIEPLTFIIGYNASGKSNVFDALHFLSELSKGTAIDEVGSDIRGGKDWIISREEESCGIDVKIHNDDTDFFYTIEFAKKEEKLVITQERLSENSKDLLLTEESKVLPNEMLLSMTSYTAKQGRRRQLQVLRDKSALFQLASAGLRKEGVNIISCPTCGRTRIDLIGLVNQVEAALKNCEKPITVAVMGCVVNGPGEAREADIGIAGGDGWGTIFEKGQQVDKPPYEELLPALLARIENL